MTTNDSQGHEAWKAWIPDDARQHLRAARQAMREGVEAMFPPEFIQSRRAARREMLLAARSLIDHALQRMDETSKA
ncbi:MAG TPA: hypothetical protein VLD63_11485 [Anaerolineales bacterium]|nr:hypothetical protein [Anaerolineales bacterium]